MWRILVYSLVTVTLIKQGVLPLIRDESDELVLVHIVRMRPSIRRFIYRADEFM